MQLSRMVKTCHFFPVPASGSHPAPGSQTDRRCQVFSLPDGDAPSSGTRLSEGNKFRAALTVVTDPLKNSPVIRPPPGPFLSGTMPVIVWDRPESSFTNNPGSQCYGPGFPAPVNRNVSACTIISNRAPFPGTPVSRISIPVIPRIVRERYNPKPVWWKYAR